MIARPPITRCAHCGHVAAQVICSLCKKPRPEYLEVMNRKRVPA